jgi:hypothetical protein
MTQTHAAAAMSERPRARGAIARRFEGVYENAWKLGQLLSGNRLFTSVQFAFDKRQAAITLGNDC